MRLKNILFGIVCIIASHLSIAQTINLQVRITAVERTNYSDCSACGSPDPTWKITAVDNAPGSITVGPYCFHYDEDGNNIEPQNLLIWNRVNSSATSFTLGMNDAFEKNCTGGFFNSGTSNCDYNAYSFTTCSPAVYGDGNRCQNPNLAVVNFMDSSPCAVHNTISAWCGDYRFHYSFTWSFNYAPNLVTQPVANTSLCLGNTTALSVASGTDAHGWSIGQNYQWQISTNTACPGTNWTDIVNATSSTYTPAQIAGTRLYRVLVTSNCSGNFNTNTTTSNCAVVTYNPIGGAGDPIPPIVSGICGSTVLPGSVHTLNILTPPSPGAVIGATGYAWTASGGTPRIGSSPSFVWTAPSAAGTYYINLAYQTACPPDAIAPTCVVTVGSSDCDFAYIAPSGVDSLYAGGPDVPFQTLGYALTQLAGRTKIRMAVGYYDEKGPLNLINNLVIDGGYVIGNGIWSKSNSDSTNIHCSGVETINGNVAHRVGFKSNGASNWQLQDLVIRTADISSTTANGLGFSNYGILAYNASSNFKLTRTKIYAGAGAYGTDGFSPSGAGGAGGHGNGGGGGGGGSGCNSRSGNGANGSAGSGGSAGNGGGGCSSSGCNTIGCGSSSCQGGGGTSGNPGAGGSSYVAGNRPGTPGPSPTYYLPAGQAGFGTNGTGGGGGGGGAGSSSGTCCSCLSGGCGGGASGGRGGNGGDGGLSGTGGSGGGGSFAIYASGAGTSGTIVTSLALPGPGGIGGTGGSGQPGTGGAGGAGGNSQGLCFGASLSGGAGGRGGDGGDGGRGQDGANGLSQGIVTVNGATMNGVSTSVPNNYTLTINYNNAKACIYSEIGMSKSSGTWSLPSSLNYVNDVRDAPATPAATSFTNGSTNILVYATTPNQDIDLSISGTLFAAYLKISADNRQLPVITLSDHVVCLNGSVTLHASSWGTELEYDWRIYQGASVSNPLYTSSVASPTVDFTGYAPGKYVVRYKVRESCCGWSIPVYDTIDIAPLPVQYTVQGGGNYCPGGAGVPILLSGSEPGVKYVVYFNGQPVDSAIGTGASPLVFNNETQVGAYSIIGYRFTACGQNMLGFVNVGLSPTPTIFNVYGGGFACPNATVGPPIYLSGSQVGVSYQLFLNAVTPVGNPLQGTGNRLQFSNIGQAGVYTVIGTFMLSPYCGAAMSDSALIVPASVPTAYTVTGGGAYCMGDSGRAIGMAQTDTGTTYSLYLNGGLVSGPIAGTGSPISFGVFALSGTYTATARNYAGCDTTMINTVTITPLSLPVISSLTSTDISCSGGTDDTIKVAASSSNGSLHYSVDSGMTYVNSTGVITAIPAGNYYVYVRDDSSCRAAYPSNPVVISQPAAPLMVSSIVYDISCNGTNDGSIQLLPSGGWGAYTYSWSSGQTIQIINNLPAAVYVGSVTDIRGCTVSVTDTIHNPTPITDSISGGNVSCAGANNGFAHVTVNGGRPPYSFLWSNFAITQNIDSLTGGLYSVIITDANGCQKRDSVRVREGQPLILTDTVVPISCSGANNASIHLIVSGGSGTYTYTWSPAGSTTADTTNISAGTYQVTVSDVNGCSASASIVISNPSPLTVSHLTTNPLCYTAPNGTISLIVNGGSPSYSLSWSGGLGQQFNQSNLYAGSYTVTVTDAHGCTATDSIVLTDPAPIFVSGIPKDVSCHGKADGMIIATGYGGTLPYSYQWRYDSINGAYGPLTKDITQLSGGDYYLVITDMNGCQASYHHVIREPDSLLLSLVKTDATCQAANSGAIAAVVTGGTKPYEFLWNNFVTDSFQINIPGGNYGVEVTDSNGCHDIMSIAVAGQPSPITVNTAINNPSCNNSTNGFVVLDVQGGRTPYTYTWSTTPVQTANTATDLTGGTYYATISDASGCQVIDTAMVSAPGAITVSVGSGTTTCISSNDGYAVINVIGGVGPYMYTLGGASQSSDTFSNLPVGSYTVSVTDINHCQGSTYLNITSTGNLSVDLTGTPTFILAGEPIELHATGISDTTIIAYIWNAADSLDFHGCISDTCRDATATPHVSRIYMVTVQNARGCTATDTIRVTISDHPSVFIPSAFSPNGDGLNDRFQFDILGAKSANVQIWNRWGEKVFDNPVQANGVDKTDGWDGRFRNGDVQFDTYTYQIIVLYFDGHTENMSGTVVVMK